MFIIIVFWVGRDSCWDYIFLGARFTSFHTPASLLTVFCFFILFYSCFSHSPVFGKTLVHEFLISYSHTEWYLFLSDSAIASAQCVFGAKT